jgi:SAM-dependent methyltransferase
MVPIGSPSQFYTGLVAELYEPLVSRPARADEYVPFLELSGTPALELGCGSGIPLLDLLERGYDVEGLDASRDMLDRCRARAAERHLDPVLHEAEMQSFSLPRRYRSVFLAGASFTLLTTDEDAASALGCIFEHLEPGGGALIPLEVVDAADLRRFLGRFREIETGTGERMRVAMVAFEVAPDGRGLCRRLRYERIDAEGDVEVLERDWLTRSWTQDQFRRMLEAAGFERATFRAADGGPAEPDATVFVALARRGAAQPASVNPS